MRASKKTFGVFTTACIAVLSIVLVTPQLANAQDDAPPEEVAPAVADVPATCDVAPAGAQVSVEDCVRFVELWAPRFSDEAWIEGFVALEEVPADILAEGFHDVDGATAGWLVSSLLEHLIVLSGDPRPSDEELLRTKGTVALIIFGKAQMNQIRDDFSEKAPATPETAEEQPRPLQHVADELSSTPTAMETLEAEAPPPPDPPEPTPLLEVDVLPDFAPPIPGPGPIELPILTEPILLPDLHAIDADSLLDLIVDGLGLPGIVNLQELLSDLLVAIGDLQQTLFTLPVLNVLGGLTYRICAESPSMSLRCTISLPVGLPIPADVNGDLLPDVLGHLTPTIAPPTTQIVSLLPLKVQVVGSVDVGFAFDVQRLISNAPLPAHIFAVYDPPFTNKRVQIGFDGRGSTFPQRSTVTAKLKNLRNALAGDVELEAKLKNVSPGANLALTAAVKDLIPQGNGVLPLERNPMVAAVHFTPVPTQLTVNARLTHTAVSNRDTISIDSNLPSLVTANITQDVNTVLPNSHREYQAVINKMPTHVSVDLLNQDPKQYITYGASAVIDQIDVYQKSIDNTAVPSTFTLNKAQVKGLPSSVALVLTDAEDILYNASSTVPEISFVTQQQEVGELQKEIAAKALSIPKQMHLQNVTEEDKSTITYDADSSLGSIELGMYDLPNDKTVIAATATGFPTHLQLEQVKSTGATTYTSNGPIQTIEATLTRNDGEIIPLPNVDHATVKVAEDGEKLGFDLKLSGLSGAHFDPSEKASYGLQTTPGNQRFEAIADLDSPNRRANVEISNLPPSIQIDLDPANGEATYTADAVISQIHARYQQVDDGPIAAGEGMIADITFDSVPKEINATWNTDGADPRITYAADSRLGGITAFYQDEPGGTTFHAQALSLPLFMLFEGTDDLTFDARTAEAAPSGSDEIGQIRLQYASDGTLVSTGDPDDHLYLFNSVAAEPDVTKAELVYSGLQLIRANTEDDEVHVRVENSAPRRFEADVVTDELHLSAFVEKVPQDVQIDLVDETISWRASHVIDQIGVNVDRLNGDLVDLLISSVPKEIDLVIDSSASTVDWTADSIAGGIELDAQLSPETTGTTRTHNAELDILSIPMRWTASYAEGHILFDGISSAIGTIRAAFTNHGTYTSLLGSGLSAVFNEVTEDLDAYLLITQLDRAEFQKVDAVGDSAGGFDANLDMGSGEDFGLNANVTLADGTRLIVTGVIEDLPTEMHLRSVDGLLTYTGNDHPTINIDVAYGASAAALTATPNAPQVHGISLRDGASGDDLGIKASLFITGLPNFLRFDTEAGTYRLDGFDPDTDDLRIDVELKELVDEDIDLFAVQNLGIGPIVTMTFGPFTTNTAGNGAKVIHAGYTASRGLESLDADLTMGTDVAHLFVSNIPSSLAFDATFGDATKNVTIVAGEGIGEITANYKGSQAGNFQAGVTLKQIPERINLTIGEQGAVNTVKTPVFSYIATNPNSGLPANTLDITAFLDDLVFGPAADAGFKLLAEDIGDTLAAELNGTVLSLGSTPETKLFDLVATADLHFDVPLNFDAGPFHHTGNIGIDLDIQELQLRFTEMTSLNVRLGVSTGVDGDFGEFKFHEASDSEVTVASKLRFVAEVIGIDIDWTVTDFTITVDTGNPIGNFRLADNHMGDWIKEQVLVPPFIGLPIPCSIDLPPDTVHVGLDLRPHPHEFSEDSGFTVNGGGDAWVATVNPYKAIPGRVLDVVARFASPYGGDQDFDGSCE